MTTKQFAAAVGLTSTIDCFGDSLTQGAGGSGVTIATQLKALFPDRLVNNWGIGGQTSAQIAARQGGLPLTLTVTSNSIPASFAAGLITSISTQLLSTAADNTSRYISGQISSIPCIIERTATGGPPSTSETYNIYAASSASAQAITAGALFVPDDGWNARHSIQILWLGANDISSDMSAVAALIAKCVAYMPEPKRYVVVGVHGSAALNGTLTAAVAALNAQLVSTYDGQYASADPPTVAEMAAVGYTPTGQDSTDIAAGTWPTGLRASSGTDLVHLTGQGYQIIGNRIGDVVKVNGW